MSTTATTPLEQQPPPLGIAQQSYNLHSGQGSIGPVIAVLVVIGILGVLAGMIGRLCSGRSIMGYGQYDIESWAETKCSTCIDGRINIPTPPRGGANVSGSSTPMSAPAQTHQETKQDELEQSPPPQNPPAPNVDS